MNSEYVIQLAKVGSERPMNQAYFMILLSDIMTNHNEGYCGKIMQQKHAAKFSIYRSHHAAPVRAE